MSEFVGGLVLGVVMGVVVGVVSAVCLVMWWANKMSTR